MKIKTLFWLVPFFTLIFLDIPVFSGWDLLPDAIGYFGLFVCFTALLEHDRKFVKPQNFVLLLFLLELAFLFGVVERSGLTQVLGLIGSFGDLLVVAYTASALSSLAAKSENAELAGSSDKIFYYFLPTVPMNAVALFMPNLSGLINYVCIILYLVVLYRMYSFYRKMTPPADVPLDMEEP